MEISFIERLQWWKIYMCCKLRIELSRSKTFSIYTILHKLWKFVWRDQLGLDKKARFGFDWVVPSKLLTFLLTCSEMFTNANRCPPLLCLSRPIPAERCHLLSTMTTLQPHNVVPNIPGMPVKDDARLKEKIAELLNMKKYRWHRPLYLLIE